MDTQVLDLCVQEINGWWFCAEIELDDEWKWDDFAMNEPLQQK